MNAKERLTRQVLGKEVDRVPTLGGWIGGAHVLAALGGISIEEYLRDPFAGMVRAHRALGVDGMVGPNVPTRADQIRTASAFTEDRFPGVEPEAIVEYANTLPDGEREVMASFDAAAAEKGYRDYFANARRDWQGIEAIPNFWELGGHFPLYTQFGYTAFLSACALYPEVVHKIWWVKSLHSRARAKIMARLYRELDLIPVLFCGEDVCSNQGPLASPEFLRQYYFPTVKMIVEPLVDAGVRLVHHCDGDIRPIVDDLLAMGFAGLQGFQYELGIDPYELAQKRAFDGRPLIFFASMNVSRTLPFGTPEDVRAEVEWLHHWTDGGSRMFLFTTNVSGVEVPPENLRAGYEHVRTLPVGAARDRTRRSWPWSLDENKA
jgi:hypothetical protein